MRKINYGDLIDRSYFTRLFFFFVFISFILTYFLIKNNDSLDLILLKFVVIVFLLMFFSVFLEMPKKSEYLSMIDSIDLRHFFRNFIRNKGEGFVMKYDLKSQKNVKEIFKRGKNFEISTIQRKDDVFIISFYKNSVKKNFISGFLLGFNLHKLYIKELSHEYVIIRVK